jgi:hypothetical protein
MIKRDNQSDFIENLEIAKRGTIKVASSKLPGTKDAMSHNEVQRALSKFDHSPDIDKKVLEEYKTRAQLSDKPEQEAKDFLKKIKDKKQSLTVITVKALRQSGVFKSAGRDVYEDLETGDFWKISDDRKHVVRLFKESEEGVSDKKASKIAVDISTDKYTGYEKLKHTFDYKGVKIEKYDIDQSGDDFEGFDVDLDGTLSNGIKFVYNHDKKGLGNFEAKTKKVQF